MDFIVDNGAIQFPTDKGSTKAFCFSIGSVEGVFAYSGTRLYNLIGGYPHTINGGDDLNSYHDFQDAFLEAGGTKPPNYAELVEWLDAPLLNSRIDKRGDRSGVTFTGIYATGITQLDFTDLTGLTISEFNGTSTYSIVGNSIILDPLLTFSSLVDSDGNIYSLESLYNSNVIIGTQNCLIAGTPIILESIDYKSWRNLLGYNTFTTLGIGSMRIGSTFIIA